MSGTWAAKVGAVDVHIDTGALSRVLERAGRGPLNRIAEQGAQVARAQLSTSDQRFIHAKATREFPLKSGSLPELSRMLTIPVALIVNDSNYAVSQEYGHSARVRRIRRPLQTAMEGLAATGLRMVRGRAR